MSTILESGKQTDPVRSWRFESLIAAGYPHDEARALSERSDVDLHLAARLLERGCPIETALRILL